MKTTSIPLSGINHFDSKSASYAINLRTENGSFVPIPIPGETQLSTDGINYIHSSNTYRNMLRFSSDAEKGVSYIYWNAADSLTDTDKTELQITYEIEGIISEIKHIGNTLICLTDKGPKYLLFKPTLNDNRGGYIYLGTRPDAPKIRFRYRPHGNADPLTDSRNATNGKYFTITNPKFGDYSAINKEYEQILSDQGHAAASEYYCNLLDTDFDSVYNSTLYTATSSNGRLPNFPTMVRIAVRLYDDTYILHSPPLLLNSDFGLDSFIYRCNPISQNSNATFKEGSRARLETKELEYRLSFDVGNWTDIVKSIDIFISKPITPFKIGEKTDYNSRTALTGDILRLTQGDLGTFVKSKKRSKDDILEDIKAINTFYRLKSIKTEEAINDIDWVSLAEEIKENYATLAAQTANTLPDDTGQLNTYSAGCAFVYNQSLHLGDITTQLFEGYDPSYFIINDASDQSSQDISVSIEEDGSTMGTVSKVLTLNRYQDAGAIITDIENVQNHEQAIAINPVRSNFGYISPMLYFPNTDAKQMQLILESMSDSGKYLSKTLSLTKHDFLNGTYYIDPDLCPIALSDHDEPTPISEQRPTLHEPNRMLTTNISNPFVFNIENSNLIGNSCILAFGVATTALSQGQYGKHPLYVFCTDGVYALPVSDDGSYTSTHPAVSFDTLISKSLVCSTDRAVIFASKQGLKMLQGSTITNISQPLQGSLHRIDPNGDYNCPDFYTYVKDYIDKAAPLLNDIRKIVDIKGMQLLFDYHHSELWLCAPGVYDIAYIYNLTSQQWTMRTISCDSMLSDYPYLYALKDKTLYNLSEDDTTAQKLPFVYISNPIGGAQRTRILNVIANAYAINANISMAVAVGQSPYRLQRLARSTAGVNILPSAGLHIRRIPLSVRYMRFAIYGSADNATLIGISMATELSEYNDIR